MVACLAFLRQANPFDVGRTAMLYSWYSSLGLHNEDNFGLRHLQRMQTSTYHSNSKHHNLLFYNTLSAKCLITCWKTDVCVNEVQ